ncbi:MAG: DUF4352 domain-containing protein, partial [Catenulispora sp.]|nr:DUF4352 domain-containing protein [Catenulispora sp.]
MRVPLLVAGLLLALVAPARADAADPGLGDSITLTGDVEGDVVTVTPLKVANPASAADDYSAPGAGDKLVGVQFRLRNTGDVTYTDSPDNCATLVDTDGQRFHPTIGNITAGPEFPGSVTMSPGGAALGWIVFELPSSARPASVQFTPDSGFADDTGEWTLPAGNTAANPPAAASPADVVTAYVDAINSGDYHRAWLLGGSSFDSDEGHFAAGFETTRHDTLTI